MHPIEGDIAHTEGNGLDTMAFVMHEDGTVEVLI